MGLYTRADHEATLRELDRLQAKANRLLVTCAHCSSLFEAIPGLYTSTREIMRGKQGGPLVFAPNPEVMEEVYRHRAEICCAECGEKRESKLGVTQHREISREIDRARRAADIKLASTALVIGSQKRMEKSPGFAWVVGAAKEHQEGECKKLQGEDYCTCRGLWYQTRKKGVLLKYMNPRYRDSTVMEVQTMDRRGVCMIEVEGRRKQEKEDDGPPPEPEQDEIVWKKVPIVELQAYLLAGEWGTSKKGERIWKARYMIRYESTVIDGKFRIAEFFEAAEVA